MASDQGRHSTFQDSPSGFASRHWVWLQKFSVLTASDCAEFWNWHFQHVIPWTAARWVELLRKPSVQLSLRTVDRRAFPSWHSILRQDLRSQEDNDAWMRLALFPNRLTWPECLYTGNADTTKIIRLYCWYISHGCLLRHNSHSSCEC